MCVLALMLPGFNAELLTAAPGTLTQLTLLAERLPYAFFDDFLVVPTRARLSHLTPKSPLVQRMVAHRDRAVLAHTYLCSPSSATMAVQQMT